MAEEADTGNRCEQAAAHSQGRLLSRPSTPAEQGPAGLHELQLPGNARPALLYVPERADTQPSLPLVVVCHGAGGAPRDGLALLQNEAKQFGLVLLAPGSWRPTWDVIQGGYGPDARAVDAALHHVFAHYRVDAHHLAMGGFSDGASYALSVGITNGRLFTHVLAFSPGFLAPTRQPDTPRIYVSHGMDDEVLVINACSRRLVPALERAGYEVSYHEFAGGHMVPADIRAQAVQWFLGS